MALLIDILAAGVIDNSGNPLDSGKVYVYETGTTTPVTTYQDSDLTQPNSNPIVLDSVGRAEVYINEDVRLVIEDSLGATILDIDALGSNTALQGGTTVLGTTSADVIEINGSIDGDIIPTIDDTYDVGSTSKRWSEGHFVGLNTTTLDVETTITGGTLQAVGANTPRWISNLGIKLDSGTLSVVASDGTNLSTTNYGYVTCKSTTHGQVIPLKCTYAASIQDATATSNFTNMGFGIDESTNQTDVRFYIYVANKANSNIDGVDGSSVFFISIDPGLDITPASSNNIGDTGAIASTDDATSILIMQNVTIANYVSLPCTLVASFEMDWDTSPNDWTIQTLATDDGVGGRLPLTTNFANDAWEKVTRSTGTSVGTRGVAISAESGVITETTTTPQDIGVTATIITTGRPVWVGLICDTSIGYILVDSSGSASVGGFVHLYRDGTMITKIPIDITLGGGITTNDFKIPPSSIWYVDVPTAASHDYTCRISRNWSGTTIEVDNVKIVAFEI